MRSRRLLLGLALGAGCFWGRAATTCWGQQTPAAPPAGAAPAAAAPAVPAVPLPTPLPDSLKHSTAVPPNDPQIVAAVQSVCKVLADGTNPTGQSAARVWLIQCTLDSAGGLATASFLQQYSRVLNQQLSPLLKPDQANLRLKIEAGVAAKAISDKSHNYELAGVVSQLVADKSAAAALVGIQAAGSVLPSLLMNRAAFRYTTSLCNQIIQDVQTFKDGALAPLITDNAYTALDTACYNSAVPSDALVEVLVPAILSLEDGRASIYKAMLPASPQADYRGVVALLYRRFWTTDPGARMFDGKTQVRVLQMISDLTGLTSQWAATTPPGQERSELIESLKHIGQTLNAFSNDSGPVPDPTMNAAAAQLVGLGPASAANQVTTAEFSLRSELKTFAQSRDASAVINDPPQVASAKQPES